MLAESRNRRMDYLELPSAVDRYLECLVRPVGMVIVVITQFDTSPSREERLLRGL